ncbi:MAG: DUF2207 domain-containing protein [Candidatus Melainabacteria bacterium]|nr:DUF2207 domain-containing protein [Candidatus Melainabacteria bacterium]
MRFSPSQLLIPLIALVASSCVSVQAAEVIRSYNVDARLMKDRTLDVRETISIDYGKTPRHGIERIYGQHRNISIADVSDPKGKSLTYVISNSADRVHLKIGSPNKTVSGLNEYKIHYQLRDAVTRAGTLDWSPTGHRWQQPIQKFSMNFASDLGKIQKLPAACIINGNTRPEVKLENSAVKITAANLKPGSGIDLSFEDLNGLSSFATQIPNFGSTSNMIPLLIFVVMIVIVVALINSQNFAARFNCGCRCGDKCRCSCPCSSVSCTCVEANRDRFLQSQMNRGFSTYSSSNYTPDYNYSYYDSSSSSDYSGGDSSGGGNNDDGGGGSW